MITNSFYSTKLVLNRNLSEVQLQCSAIKSKLEETPDTTLHLHPNLPAIYQDKITSLIDALNTPDTITQANEAVRQLIEKVRLVPEGNILNIELFGELAALLSLGVGPDDKHPLANAEGVQVTLVAGARNRRYLHLDFANLQCRQYCMCGVAQAPTIEM